MNAKELKYFVAKGESLKLDSASRQRLKGNYVQLADGITHYSLSGPESGDLVLLVPGLTIPLFYWDEFAGCLNELGYRTLSYSAYGRGYSDRVINSYSQVLFMRQAGDLLRKLNLDVSHVVATSMGALIAMGLLVEGRLSPKSLTLIGPAGIEEKKNLIMKIAQVKPLAKLFGRHCGQKTIKSHLGHNVKRADSEERLKGMVCEALGYEGSMYSLLSTLRNFPLTNQRSLFKKVGDLNIPTLLAWGSDDQITPIGQLEVAKSLLVPKETVVIEDCGHMAPLEEPERTSKVFVEFVNKLLA